MHTSSSLSDATSSTWDPTLVSFVRSLSDATLESILTHMHVVALPMHVKFRGVTLREAALLEGPSGWGEFSPFVEYPPEEAALWLAAALEQAFFPVAPPEGEAARVPVNATIPAVPAEKVEEVMRRFGSLESLRTIKIKVGERGQTLDDDIDRVAAVRSFCLPTTRLRVDANCCYPLPLALRAARRLGELEYMEQPGKTLEDLKEIRECLRREGLTTRIAADESIRRADDPLAIVEYARQGSLPVDAAVLKVAPLGGVRRTLKLADTLGSLGIQITIASALDTEVGISAGLSAAAWSALHAKKIGYRVGDAGLATGRLMKGRVTHDVDTQENTLIAASVHPDPELLVRYAARPERRQWWEKRLVASAKALQKRFSVKEKCTN